VAREDLRRRYSCARIDQEQRCLAETVALGDPIILEPAATRRPLRYEGDNPGGVLKWPAREESGRADETPQLDDARASAAARDPDRFAMPMRKPGAMECRAGLST
jgi:hypothetical protein